MTEKDFRKLVTDLELTKADKEMVQSFIDSLKQKLDEHIKYLKVSSITCGNNMVSGIYYHGSKNLELIVVFEKPDVDSFPLMNQVAINELWNFLIFNYKLEKMNQISFDEQANAIVVDIKDMTITINIRFEQELNYQTDFGLEQDKVRQRFINMANSEFNLFKNTMQLVSYLKDQNDLNGISDYQLELLLYYGLSENFTKHSYEVYLKELTHAIDDLLKGIRIDQDDTTYRNLNLSRGPNIKNDYTIIDIANPKINLCSTMKEAGANEFKKLKKIILKFITPKSN